ncbi:MULTISPECIES: hypothetical protein [Acetobacter]|nr:MULTISPECIES: hypothetical protein [Acetobacter]ATI12938.1 hypothetical protein CPF11_11160 [Acetobacter pomorum]AXC26937.1 hypothetical protein DS739_09230 [Acetobacter sp. JWB]KAA8422397.1 hypothetical protein FKW54_12275 [Acetobacter pomorum]KAA8438794.1 hypothetical protein FKW50_00405 [Acetobacter pomorum]KAA8450538.1 hypothetical protein FKW52_10070 [Acetobacter pomorum]
MLYSFFRSELCAAMALCLAVFLPSTACGAEKTRTPALNIAAPCLNSLHIRAQKGVTQPEPANGQWPTGLQLATNSDGSLSLAGQNCQADTNLTLTTPPNMPLVITSTGRTAIQVDDRKGPVFLQAGSGAVTLGRTAELNVTSDSTGAITIPVLADSARLRSTLSAPFMIGKVQAPALAIYLGGSASFTTQQGKLEALEITSNSTADAVFHGETSVAALHVENAGNILVDKATGTLATERDGKGKIVVTSTQGNH